MNFRQLIKSFDELNLDTVLSGVEDLKTAIELKKPIADVALKHAISNKR